jgi:hypothetical protein
MDPFVLIPLLIVGGIVYLFVRRSRDREKNAPLRGEIEARVCFATPLDRVSKLGTGGFEGGTRGYWIALRGPTRLTVGTDAFMVSAPQALREYVFTGRESSIAFSQEPSRVVKRDWIIITGQSATGEVQLAVSRRDAMPQIWEALAGTGAALVPRLS